MINNRLIKIFSNKKIFNSNKKDYYVALTSIGYDRIKGYNKKDLNSKSNKTKISERIIYFNLAFCNSVKTNLIKRFLDLVCLHFPKNNKLHKIINRNTIKIM